MSELNLIPYELKQKKVNESQLRYYVLYGIIVVVAVVVAVLIPKLYITYLNTQEDAIVVKIANNSSAISENKKLLTDISNYKLYSDKADNLTKQKVIIADKLGDISKYAPTDITFSNMALIKGAMTISGNTKNYKSVSVFVANLQISKEYSSAKIVNISDTGSKEKSTAGKYQFSISIPTN